MNCPSCRQALHEDARYCSHCGLSTSPIQADTNEVSRQETLKYEHPADRMIGMVLDSKYHLIERLGEGGMGAVYRARRLHIGDEVAVKVLHADLLVEPNALERFRREARSAAMISHSNIVSIYDFSDAKSPETPAYIVMELVRGTSLRKLLKTDGRLSVERTVDLMQDICAGVGVAHKQGIVHRDLKPDNVIIAPPSHEGDSETAKVVDFGIAKLRDSAVESGLTRPGVVVGTIFYMAPEQCRGEELDPRSDVYSLGSILYEMLTGEPPFQANNMVGLINKHLTEPPPPLPSALNVPEQLSTICFRALAKERNERPADALELRRELQRAFEPLSPAVQPVVTVPARKGAYGWVTWVAVSLGVLLVLVVVSGLVGVYIYSKRDSEPGINSTTEKRSDDNRLAVDQESDIQVEAGSGISDLRGTWTGAFGPLGLPATLTIENHRDQNFDGVLEQSGVRVEVQGSIDTKTRELRMKETRVLSGGSWSLGENTGKISSDGNKMSGSGQDPIGGQFGILYQWSFARS